MAEISVAVIIPFFQREQGLLARALRSVRAQVLLPNVVLSVIVVDDESPVPIEAELEGLEFDAPHRLMIIRQANAGPGGGRNRALESDAAQAAQFVAFLDSDDVWMPEHLGEALRALGDTRDYYFCDHIRFNIGRSGFEELAAPQQWAQHRDTTLTPIGDICNVFALAPREMLTALLTDYLSQTSTVVYRFAGRARALRFDTDLRGAGEDHMFWIDLTLCARSVAISYNRAVYCGRGVNVYYSALDWTRGAGADRYGYLLLFLIKLSRRFPLEYRDHLELRRLVARRTKAYAFLFGRALLLNLRPNVALLIEIFKLAPSRVLRMPLEFLLVFLGDRRDVFP